MGMVRVVATPIGNLQDITLRALEALGKADLLFAEDTRRTRILLDRHGIPARPVSLHEHNESSRIAQALAVLWVVLRTRPEVILSTGASPGFFAMLFGRLLGRKTIWVDSIANVDEMSLSGQQARYFADLWLTQWEHLARPEGPKYFGAVL